MSQAPVTGFTAIMKEIFWRPATGLLAALLALLTCIALLKSTAFPNLHTDFRVVDWVLSWQWETWVTLWLVGLIVVILKGAVDAVHRREDLLAVGERLRKAREDDSVQAGSAPDSQERTGNLEAELVDLRAWSARLEFENLELRAKQAEFDKVPFSFSLETLAPHRRLWPTPGQRPSPMIRAHGIQSGQPATLILTVLPVVLVIKKVSKKFFEVAGISLQSPTVTGAPREFPLPCPKMDNPLRLPITEELLKALAPSGEILLGQTQPESTSLAIKVQYRTESSTRWTHPQTYEVAIKQSQGVLNIQACRSGTSG